MYQGQYTLVGNELSFFSRKLEAQLRFQQIPWHWQFKTQEQAAEIEARAGTHFIPLLMTPEKWLIHDTIALGPMLDSRFPQQPVIPSTPVQRSGAATDTGVRELFAERGILEHYLDKVDGE
jgi:glutathione S-transferase